MKYFVDGYHFFTEEKNHYRQEKDNPKSAGFSLFRNKQYVLIEPFPEKLSGLTLYLLCNNEKKGLIPYCQGIFKRGAFRIPYNFDMSKIAAVIMTEKQKPVFTALPQGSQLDLSAIFNKDKKSTNISIQKEVTDFDPFYTTNPAYSWQVCLSEQFFLKQMDEKGISLPLSLKDNAKQAFALYKHLLFGKYIEEITAREFFIIGVPTESQSNSCTYNEKYNAARYVTASLRYNNITYAGYHLYYIDKKSTALVKVVLKNKNQ